MISHHEPGPPHGALAFFGGRQVTRWRHIERGRWLRDRRRVTQTLTDSIFTIWCSGVILNMSLCWCVDQVTKLGMVKKGLQDSWDPYRAVLFIGQGYYDHNGLFCVESYQLLNRAVMYLSVNILWFCCDLLTSFTADFITQNKLTPTCIMHLAWYSCN